MNQLKSVEKIRSSIIERLVSRHPKNHHQAAALAYDICLLKALDRDISEKEFEEYREAYLALLSRTSLTDTLNNQVSYAIRIASHPDELEYEEMFKLFTLSDSINAMQMLGMKIDEKYKTVFEIALRDRFKRDVKKAKLVAEDLVKDWKKDWWWYTENLKSSLL